MNKLIVAVFNNTYDAIHTLEDFSKEQEKYKSDFLDACVIIRHRDGSLELKQGVESSEPHILSGAGWGGLLGALSGLIVLNPVSGLLAGAAIGTGIGAISGMLDDYGINNDFLQKLGTTLKEENSALFIVFREAVPEEVLGRLDAANASVIHTPLKQEAENALRQELKKIADMPEQERELPANTINFLSPLERGAGQHKNQNEEMEKRSRHALPEK